MIKAEMVNAEMLEGSLMYHAVHGLFRVDAILKKNPSGETVRSYSLVPQKADRAKTRFIIACACMGESGFHGLVSLQEANQILQYLRDGIVTKIPSRNVLAAPAAAPPTSRPDQAWDLAKMILAFSFEKFEARDQKKRQMLARSAKGLIGELAFVLNMTLKETAEKIQKSLGHALSINPLVLKALVYASED